MSSTPVIPGAETKVGPSVATVHRRGESGLTPTFQTYEYAAETIAIDANGQVKTVDLVQRL